MINLLPYEMKKQLKAARLNNILLRYIIVLLAGGLFIALLGLGLNFYIDNTKSSLESIITSTTSDGSSSNLEAQLQALKQQVDGAKTIVDSGEKYSNILIKLSQTLPEGVILEKLNLGEADFGKPTQLTFYAKSTEVANTIDERLSTSNLFTGVTLGTVNQVVSSPIPGYPVSAAVTLTFNKGASL